MEGRRLKDVQFFHALRVDVHNNYFKNQNYDITLSDDGFITVTHKVSKAQAITTLNNMIQMRFEDTDAPSAQVKTSSSQIIRKKKVVKTGEELVAQV